MSDTRLQAPLSMVVNGSSGVGKSEWIKKLIRYRDQMIYPPPEKIIWCYRTWQPTYTDLIGQVEFVKGLNYKIDGNQATLLVLDDMMMQLNDDIVNLFVAGRHDNVSVIFVTHNIFFKKYTVPCPV